MRITEEFGCAEMYSIVQESMHIVNVLMYLDLWRVRRAEGGDNATRQSSFAPAPASRPSCPPEGGGREGGLRTSGLRATASLVRKILRWVSGVRVADEGSDDGVSSVAFRCGRRFTSNQITNEVRMRFGT